MPRMRTSVMVAVGAVLPLVLGASLGGTTTTEGAGTWAAPMPAGAFLVLSLGLAVSHLLVLPGYLAVARATHGLGRTSAWVAAAGTALLTGCEVWSGLEARTALDAAVLDLLDTGYAVGALLVVVGGVGAGVVLRRQGSPLGWPLLVNGAALAVATMLRLAVSDGLGIVALTGWSLLYLWVALALRRVERGSRLTHGTR